MSPSVALRCDGHSVTCCAFVSVRHDPVTRKPLTLRKPLTGCHVTGNKVLRKALTAPVNVLPRPTPPGHNSGI